MSVWMLHGIRQRAAVLVIAVVLALLGGAVLPVGIVRSAGGLTFTVNTPNDTVDAKPGDGQCLDANRQCSLRAAIMEANAARLSSTTLSPFTIDLPGGQTYNLTITGAPEDNAAAGDLDIRVPMSILSSTTSPAIIQGVGNSTAKWTERILEVNLDIVSGEVQLRGLQIQGGVATVETPTVGGGIYAHGAGLQKLILTNCTLAKNRAVNGGAIYTGALITNLSDPSHGALSLVNTTVTANQATAGDGGGIMAQGSSDVRIDHSTVSNNTAAQSGGGIESYTGTPLQLLSSTVSGNTSQGVGGGISHVLSFSLVNSTVSGNTSQADGGGIYAAPACCVGSVGGAPPLTATLTDSTVSGNTAAGKGGGIVNAYFNVAMELRNVTVAANTAGTAAGGILNGSSGTIGLANTIVGTNKLSSGVASDCSGTVNSEGYNLISTTSGCTLGGSSSEDLLNLNPLLEPLQDNGGPTQTQALLAFNESCSSSGGCLVLPPSPAIDAGNPAPPSNTTTGACATTDQRGVVRPIDGNGDGTARCDMGAYEAPAGSSLGTFALTPPDDAIPVGQHKLLSFAWTVPGGLGWRSLDSLHLLLRDDQGTVLWLRFHELTGSPGTFSLVNPVDNTAGPEYAPGTPNQLETNAAIVYLATSSVDGPPGQTVTLKLDLGFKPSAAGRKFDVLVMAVSDAGKAEGLVPAGRLMAPPGAY